MASSLENVTDTSDDESDDGEILDDGDYQQTNTTDDDIDGFRSYLKTKFEKITQIFSPTTKTNTERIDLPMFTGPDSGHNLVTTKAPVGDSKTDIYNFNHRHRGLAIIINNETFQSKEEEYLDRPGSTKDAIALVTTMKHLGFHVFLQENLTASKILATLHSVSKDYNHSLADCFVCIILSHGHQVKKLSLNKSSETIIHEDVVVGIDGKLVAIKAILENFNDKNCPHLQGKPRLFFFQACRGSKVDDGVHIELRKRKKESKKIKQRQDMADFSSQISKEVEENIGDGSYTAGDEQMDEVEDQPDAKTEVQLKKMTVSNPAPLHKDFLVMYATPPGYYSWRRPTGSWFIQSLCKALNKREVRHLSLINILAHVSRLVAEMYESCTPKDPTMHKKKEMPVIQSMLVKDVIFSKKNKRSLMEKMACA